MRFERASRVYPWPLYDFRQYGLLAAVRSIAAFRANDCSALGKGGPDQTLAGWLIAAMRLSHYGHSKKHRKSAGKMTEVFREKGLSQLSWRF